MTQPYPLPRETRSSGANAFNGADQVYGPFDFRIFDIEDVAVYVKHDGEEAYTRSEGLTVTKTADLDFDTFSVDFGTVHPATSTYIIQGERTAERATAVTRGGGINTLALEKEFSKIAVADQELRRDVDQLSGGAGLASITDVPALVAAAQAAQAAAEGAAETVAAMRFPDRAGLRGANVSPAATVVTVMGNETPGDSQIMTFRRVASEPAHGGEQSADGAWWQRSDSVIDLLSLKIPNGVDNNDADLAEALALGDYIIIPKAAQSWVFDTVELPSGKLIDLRVPDLLVKQNGGRAAGLWYKPGCLNTHMFGKGTVTYTVDAFGDDPGSTACILFGDYLYGDGAIAEPVRHCSMMAELTVNCTGPLNGKPLFAYGFVEDCEARFPDVEGITNYVVGCHWGRDTSDTATTPTKTWHPHRLRFYRGHTKVGHVNADGYRFSGVGLVYLDEVQITDMDECASFFCGDFGAIYAQNITDDEAMQIHIGRVIIDKPGKFGISVDCQTLPALGFWTGSDHAASLHIGEMIVRVAPDATSVNALAASFLDTLKIDSLKVEEEGDTNVEFFMELFGINTVEINGKVRASNGVLVRNCGDVTLKLNSRSHGHAALTNGVSLAANSTTTTVAASVVVGQETVRIDDCDLVAGAGGLFRYETGGTTYEWAIRSSTYDHAGEQTIACDPCPVYLPNGATVTIIQTVKSFKCAGSVFDGWHKHVRCTGSTPDTKLRNVNVSHTVFMNAGLYDVEAREVKGFVETGSTHSGGGKGGVESSYGTVIGTNSEQFTVVGNVYDDTCTDLRYLTFAAGQHGVVASNMFMAVNAGATSPAGCYKGNANMTVTGNYTGPGVTQVYEP